MAWRLIPHSLGHVLNHTHDALADDEDVTDPRVATLFFFIRITIREPHQREAKRHDEHADPARPRNAPLADAARRDDAQEQFETADEHLGHRRGDVDERAPAHGRIAEVEEARNRRFKVPGNRVDPRHGRRVVRLGGQTRRRTASTPLWCFLFVLGFYYRRLHLVLHVAGALVVRCVHRVRHHVSRRELDRDLFVARPSSRGRRRRPSRDQVHDQGQTLAGQVK